LAAGLIRQYAENGPVLAKTLELAITKEMNNIPAEIIAEQLVRMEKTESVFSVGKHLEAAAYLRKCPTFDQLDISVKALLGALLDFCSVDRSKFAEAWAAEDKKYG
jgi:hypothetical protein